LLFVQLTLPLSAQSTCHRLSFRALLKRCPTIQIATTHPAQPPQR
jgi:hypothetical protein